MKNEGAQKVGRREEETRWHAEVGRSEKRDKTEKEKWLRGKDQKLTERRLMKRSFDPNAPG